MQYSEEHLDFDRFLFEDMLANYIIGYDLEYDDRNFLENLLDAAHADLKMNETFEHYEECHKIKHFMLWAYREF